MNNMSVAYNIHKRSKMKNYAKGGEVNEKLDPSYQPKGTSLVSKILCKMAEGGQVPETAPATYNPNKVVKVEMDKTGKINEVTQGELDKREAEAKLKGMGFSKGGMVDNDDMESQMMAPEFHDEDFLSDEEDDKSLDNTYPDPDNMEGTEGMKKKNLVSKILMKR